MKPAIPTTLLTIALVIFVTGIAAAAEERTAYEFGDGHWIYFGPSQSPEWTASRKMPLKRSLEQSIRGDALRHYEMPQFVLPESGIAISFHGAAASRPERRTRVVDRDVRALPDAAESPRGIYELPESGMIIEFPREDRSYEEEPTLARHGENRL